MSNNYFPDLAAFDRNQGKVDGDSMEQKFRAIRRNLELIAKAINGNEAGVRNVIVNGVPGTPVEPVELVEENYFVKIWQIYNLYQIPEDERYATTGLKIYPNGGLEVSGELEIF